jgi:hypothetical protein
MTLWDLATDELKIKHLLQVGISNMPEARYIW